MLRIVKELLPIKSLKSQSLKTKFKSNEILCAIREIYKNEA